MSIQHSIHISRPIADVFAIYKDVSSWSEWDPDIEAVGLDGPFEAGSSGWLKPVGAPRTKTLMSDVSEPNSFTVQASLPLCTMTFMHELHEESGGTSATHSVIFSGLLAPIFSRLIGPKIRHGIAATMSGLKTYAESK